MLEGDLVSPGAARAHSLARARYPRPGAMDVASQLAPANVLARAWGFLEVNGWYVVAAVASYFFLLRPYVLDPAMRARRGLGARAHPGEGARLRGRHAGGAPTPDGGGGARGGGARRARARAPREGGGGAAALGVRRRGGGRRSRRRERRRGRRRRAATQAEAEKSDGDDPFKRLRDRNPLGPDASRSTFQAPRRKVNSGG